MTSIDLSTFFLSISSAAFMGLGLVPRPGARQNEVDLELARQNIDLLLLMKAKTRGNRTEDEERLLERLLFETQMKFNEVEATTKSSK